LEVIRFREEARDPKEKKEEEEKKSYRQQQDEISRWALVAESS